MQKIDPRKIRTRKMLRDALIAMILEKGYDATSIQDITERAGLRRATFYLHYRDKEELLLHTLHDTLDDLFHKMDALPKNSPGILNSTYEYDALVVAFHHAKEHADLYRTILNGQGAVVIMRNVRDYLAKRISEKCHDLPNIPIPIEISANFMAAVQLNTIVWWLEKGMPYTPEEMADMCTRLLLDGVRVAFPEASVS